MAPADSLSGCVGASAASDTAGHRILTRRTADSAGNLYDLDHDCSDIVEPTTPIGFMYHRIHHAAR